jgi:homoserine dehydrogenase
LTAKADSASREKGIGIGLLGLGVVGTGVARVLAEKSAQIAGMVGCPVTLKVALVRDVARPRPFQVPHGLLTEDVETVLNSPEVDIVVEVMGGQDPALDYILRSISLGKHLATANKEVMARHGPGIMAAAREKGVHVQFEASVAGGTPIIAPLLRDLVANDVVAVYGIVNGTTNFILTKMANEGVDFGSALAEAQALGYAEADPASDVEGTDAAYKLAILSTLAFRARVMDTDVYREGITRLRARDFLYARELGYVIKLLAMARKHDRYLQVRVHPVFVPANVLLAKVDGVLNAVEIEADLAGWVLFHGRGAGSLPTASAVVADIVDISRKILGGVRPSASLEINEDLVVRPMSELESKYYIRMIVEDRPGVLAQISKVLGDTGISISSVIQKEMNEPGRRAEVVLMTHRAKEAWMQQALALLEELDVVQEIGNMVRVEEWGE